MSKSWFLVFMADAWQAAAVLFWLALAFACYWAGRRELERKSRRAAPFFVFAFVFLLMPFLGRNHTASRDAAQALCNEIGGARPASTLPVRAESIHAKHLGDINLYELSELLQQDSFAFAEYSTDDRPGVMVYRIEPAGAGRCATGKVGTFDRTDAFVLFHEHGMRADECISHEPQPKASAAVTYTVELQERREPVRVDVWQHRYAWSDTGATIWSHASFVYRPVNPYSSDGQRLAVNCHATRLYPPFFARKGIVDGSGVPRRWPGQPIEPALVSSRSEVALLAIRRTPAPMEKLDDERAYALYRDAMDLRVGGPQVWRPWQSDPSPTRVSWGEDDSATTVDVPAAGDLERRRIRMLSAKLADGHLFLLRLLDGTWELSDYDIAAREWRRVHVSLQKPAVPWITSMEIRDDRVVISGLALRHVEMFPTLVDNGFEIEFPRP